MYIHIMTHLEDTFPNLDSVQEFVSSLNRGQPLPNNTNLSQTKRRGHVTLFSSLNDAAQAADLDKILRDQDCGKYSRAAFPIIVCYVPTSTNIKVPSQNKTQPIREFYSTNPVFAETAKLLWVTSRELILERARQVNNIAIVDTDTAARYRLDHPWLPIQKQKKRQS